MFEYEGVKYTLNDLEIQAKQQGIDVNDFIKQMEGVGMQRVPELISYDYEKEKRTYGESWGNALGRTGLNVFSGATDYVDMSKRLMMDLYFDMQDENVDQNTRSAVIKGLEEQEGLIQMFGPGLKGVGEKDIFELGIDYFGLDERIEADQTITEDLKDLNFSRAGARIIESGLESAPSLIAAYIGAPAMIGYAAILAGDKFQEEYENNPDESIKKLYFNATASGGIEMGFEMVTRGLLKKAGILAKNGNAQAAREMLKGGSTSLIKNIGVGFTGEGLSEAATELTQTLFDALPSDMGGLGKEIPSFDKLKYILGDNFIVGGFIGGGISTFGEVSKRGRDAEQKATLLLMEETEKNKIFDIGKEISKLQKDHSKANDAGKEIIENEISNKASDIQKIYDKTKLGLNNLSSSDLKTYSQNVSDINSLKQDIKENVDNDSIKDINGKKIKDLVDINKNLLNEAITKGTELQETKLQESIKFAEEKGKTIGKKTIVVKDDAASQLEYDKLREKYGEPKKDVAGTDGFILGDTIVINETVARESGAIAVGSHELLHGIIGNSFGKLNTVERAKLGKSFMNVLTSKQEAAVRKRLKDNYNVEGDAIFQSEEMFTAFSDAIIKKEISFNENIFSKIGNSIEEVLRKLSESGYIGKESFLYRKEFSNGRQVYNFLKDYTKNVQKGELSKRAQDFAKVDPETLKLKKSMTAAQKTEVKKAVDKLGQVDTDGNNLQEKGTGNFYYQADVDNVIKELRKKRTDKKLGLENEAYLDNLIAAQYKVRPVPDDFVNDVFNQLLTDIKSFKPEENNSLFGYLGPRIKFRAGDVYKEVYEKKGPATIPTEVRTKEGDIKIQVAAETDAATEAFETEDLSPAAQAKKAAKKSKPKLDQQSTFRKNIGIETGSKLYNQVLEATRVVLKRAYNTGATVRDIQRVLSKEANKYKNPDGDNLFNAIKKLLGTKNDYFKNLIKFKKPIIDVMFTADLVQMEREVAVEDRVFTEFVKKLTTKPEVQKAIDDMLLPPSAMNTYNRDKSVNLYKKIMPSDDQFLGFFNQPMKVPLRNKNGNIVKENGKTVMVRSGKRGTRKDSLVKNMVGGLTFDATMQVSQEPEVQKFREALAEQKGETLDPKDLENLSEAVGRDINLKFSISKNKPKWDGLTSKQRKTKLLPVLQLKILKEQDPIVVKELQKIIEAVEYDLKYDETSISGIPISNVLDVDAIIKDIKNTKVQDIRIMGHNAFVKLLDGANIETVKDFVKNVFRSSRSAGVMGGYTNALLKEEVLDVINNGKFKDDFELKETSTDSKKFRITYKGKEVKLYEDITNIKKNARNNVKLVDEVNKQAEQARKFILDFVKNKKLTNAQKIAGLQLLAYDQRGALRKASKMGITLNENSKLKVNDLVLEHEITVSYLLDNLIDLVNGKINETRIKEIFDKAEVHVLPKGIDKVFANIKEGGVSYKTKGGENRYSHPDVIKYLEKIESQGDIVVPARIKLSKSKNGKTFDKALMLSRSSLKQSKGITILDFDDTLATTGSLVKFTRLDGTTGTLNAEQYASTYQDLLDKGYKFDFSDFNKVVKGKLTPLFQKALKLQNKFGSNNMFVLTARPPAAQKAIFDFLKANGLNIPLKNITGLGDSTAEAKALWIADKVGEGYNDFYFADDALQNVQAVENMLNQFDVKSKVQQARVKFSKNMNKDFNKIIERTTGVPAKDIISAARASKRGAKKGKYKFFLPPSAEDFRGLLYYFIGKGRQGDKDAAFLKKALTDPLNKAYNEFNAAKQIIASDYSNLRKLMPDQMKKSLKQTPDGDFTYGDAIRVYLWNKNGFEIPGLNQSEINNLIDLVTSDLKLQEFADRVGLISRSADGYVAPSEHWQVGDIRNDLDDATNKVGRKQFFTEFIENTESIFGKMVGGKLTGDNINKIEAIYGTNFKEALEDILYRTINGTSRPYGSNRLVNSFTNWVNGSVGAVMFVNMRSALLQQMSTVNFINYGDNNIFKAAARFADQKQFWKDWTMIFNSDKLKQRRAGLSMDINANELTTYLNKSKSKTKAAINYLLRQGFKPTQISDSIAIANGGATFYRNRVNTYLDQGLSKKEAEAKAFNDFSEIAEETQQSARPDMVSQQQASSIGKWFLNFLNTPMQYSRIIKKSALDLINRRRVKNMNQMQSDTTNISRILYYGFAQNVIFYTLQTGLFAAMFDDEDDEDSKKFFDKKYQMAAQSIVDGLLRGLGFGGAAISTLKNMLIKFVEEDKKGYKGKPVEKVALEMVNLSPVVGIKVRRISNEIRSYSYDKDVIKHMETFDIDNPMWGVTTGLVEGLTNVPVNRLYRKTMNLKAAAEEDREVWERLALLSGWSAWNIGKQNNELQEIREKLKEERKQLKKRKNKKKSKIQYSPAFR